MKNRLFLLLTVFVSVSIIKLSLTSGSYKDQTDLNQIHFTVVQPLTLDFYQRSDGKAVGFEVGGNHGYDSLEYKISYMHSGIQEVVNSEVLLSGKESFKEEWVELGSCSTSVCTYYEEIGNIKLEVFLKKSGITESTLVKEIET